MISFCCQRMPNKKRKEKSKTRNENNDIIQSKNLFYNKLLALPVNNAVIIVWLVFIIWTSYLIKNCGRIFRFLFSSFFFYLLSFLFSILFLFHEQTKTLVKWVFSWLSVLNREERKKMILKAAWKEKKNK